MNFESLENFEWLNEPENVRFEPEGMLIFARPETDFWQSIHRGFKKDDGHFFYSRQAKDFNLVFKWAFDRADKFSQCGLMVRIDERNWFKASLMSETNDQPILASVLTVNGHSDWAGVYLNESVNEIWFRLERADDDYIAFYSLDGVNFVRLRAFYLQSYEEIKAGAYIASPNIGSFSAILSDITLS